MRLVTRVPRCLGPTPLILRAAAVQVCPRKLNCFFLREFLDPIYRARLPWEAKYSSGTRVFLSNDSGHCRCITTEHRKRDGVGAKSKTARK